MGLTAAESRCRDVTGSQTLSSVLHPMLPMPWLVDNFTDQLWLCCFINSISQIRLAALLLVPSSTNSLYKGRWEWCKQRESKRGGAREREKPERRPLENSAVIASSHLKNKKKGKKRVLRMKNWFIDLFNQELTQELSLRVPLTADETEIKKKKDATFQILHFWHSEPCHINWPYQRHLLLSAGF